MKNLYLLTVFVFCLVLAACAQQTEPAGPVKVDPANLPPDIDVKTATALKDQPNVLMIDVREPDEYAAGHIPGITNIPMKEVASRLSEIPTDKTVIVTCRSGGRSGQVTEFLRQQGYKKVHNMQGGIIAWEKEGLPTEK